jgi:predicted porin
MKRSHFPTALGVALCVLASGVVAQTNTTLYGRLNIGLVKETGSAWRMERGYANWLGFMGTEDLGDGVAATFHLQTRFIPQSGQNETGTFWQGESTVGLKREGLGGFRLGRALTPLWQNKYQYEPWADSWFMGSLGKYQTGARYVSDPTRCTATDCPGFARWNDGLFLDSASWNGLRASFATQVGDTAAGRRGMGASVHYEQASYSGMLSWERNSLDGGVVFAGGLYRWAGGSVMGSIARNTLRGQPAETSFVLGGTLRTGGLDMFRAAYGRNTRTSEHKLSTGYVHGLSKRTQLFADLYRERAGPVTTGFALGMQHDF